MKKLAIASILTLISMNALGATGRISIVTNDDESMMVVTGNAARELYNRLDMKPVDGVKMARDISCSIEGEDIFKCTMQLQESDSSGSKFTGVVGE